jgi:excisionase family DNA binding protein
MENLVNTFASPPPTGLETFLSPAQLAQRWGFHPESVRRKLRRRELASLVIGRKRLIPLSEVRRFEAQGRIAARALSAQQDKGICAQGGRAL